MRNNNKKKTAEKTETKMSLICNWSLHTIPDLHSCSGLSRFPRNVLIRGISTPPGLEVTAMRCVRLPPIFFQVFPPWILSGFSHKFFRFPLTFCHVIPWNFLGQPRHFFRFLPAFFRFLMFLLGIFQVSLHQLFITLSPEFCQIFPGIFVTIPQHFFFRSPYWHFLRFTRQFSGKHLYSWVEREGDCEIAISPFDQDSSSSRIFKDSFFLSDDSLLTFWYVFAIMAINMFMSKTVTNNMK